MGLGRWFDPIILTGELGAGFAKPATGGFKLIARAWREDGPHLGYVADNPEKDFVGPRQLGWLTVRIRHPNQLRSTLEPRNSEFRADVDVTGPHELIALTRAVRVRASE